MRSLGIVAAAVLSGLLTSLAFAPFNIWAAVLGLTAFSLLNLRLTPKKSSLAGYAFGCGLFSVTISYVGVMGAWIGVLMVAVMSLYTALYGFLVNLAQRFRAWPLLVSAAWIAIEFCWSRFPLGGFGWVRLAFTTPDQPLGGYLWLVGSPGAGFLVALCANLIGYATVALTAKRLLSGFIALATPLLVFGLGGLSLALTPLEEGSEEVTVGIVQGNVDGSAGPRAMGYARSVTNNHLSETVVLMAKAKTSGQDVDVVVWPENSSDHDPTVDEKTAVTVSEASDLVDAPLLIGAVMEGPGDDERQTSSLWYDHSGNLIARHDKRNAVPFGEYTPFKEIVFKLVPMAQQVGKQTVEGETAGVLEVPVNGVPTRVGTIICYELAFDNTVYDIGRNDAELVTVQSNNATYTGTLQPKQQFQITRVRAMELGREIAVSTTSSYSGLIGAKGEVLDRTEEATADSRIYTLPKRTAINPSVWLGPAVEYACLSVTLLFVTLTALKRTWRPAKIRSHE